MNIQNSVSLGQAPPPNLRTGDAAPRPAVQVPVQEKPEPTPQQLQQAVQSINQALQASNSNLEFRIDAGTKRPVVKVVDTDTGELIRQIPSEAMLAIAASIGEYQKGLLFSRARSIASRHAHCVRCPHEGRCLLRGGGVNHGSSLKLGRPRCPLARLAVDVGRASAHRQAQRQSHQLPDQDFVFRHDQRSGFEFSDRLAGFEEQPAGL